MSIFHQELKLGLKLQEALAWIGAVAGSESNPEGAQRVDELMKALPPDAEVSIRIPVFIALVHAVEEYRARGDADTVAKLEAVLAALKQGQHRVINGALIVQK